MRRWRFLPVLSAPEGAQGRLSAHKRRGVRARFCDASGRKIGYQRSQKGALGAQSGKGAPPHAIGPGLWPWGSAGYYSAQKKTTSCTYPLGSYMYEVGWKSRFFFMSSCLPGESRALPVTPGVFYRRLCHRKGGSCGVPVQLTCSGRRG